MVHASIDRQVAEVVRSGNCTGCGACCLLDPGLEMRLDARGYARPARVGPEAPGAGSESFSRVCPGLVVEAPDSSAAERHPDLGPVIASWQAWAVDPEIRFRGSSGGTITALAAWLVESGQVSQVVTAARDAADPRRTVSVTLRTPSEVVGSAGSRYAPVSNAARAVLGRADVAFIGKPCEVAAVRALARETGLEAPLLISFFCAGTPSQSATDGLVAELADESAVVDLWYRGHGWPGNFTVTLADGGTVARGYDDSWGSELGPTIQWRCKVCPDGVGEAADIVAADYWHADADGYPVFTEGDGVSALLTRTERGHEVVQRALTAGVLEGHDLDLGALAGVQPLQVDRRRTLLARTIGARLAGRRVPRYRGYHLLELSPRDPRRFARIVRATFQRVRAGRAAG